MKLRGHALGWGVLIVGVAALSRTGPPDEDRLSPRDLTRFRTYVLAEERAAGLRFPLEPDDDEVKLISWLLQPERGYRDPRAVSPYALSATVTCAEGAEAHQQTVWVRARDSVLVSPQGDRRAPAWLEDRDGQVSDDRLTRLDVGGLCANGGALSVTADHLPPDSAALLAVYRGRPQSRSAEARILMGDQPGWRRRVAALLSPFGWDSLPSAWQRNLAGRTWLRLASEEDNAPAATLETTFVRNPWDDAPAQGLVVPPGGAAAFNLEGGPLWSARWRGPQGEALAPGAVKSQVRLLRLDGSMQTWPVTSEADLAPIIADDQIASVQIALSPAVSGPRTLLVRTYGASPDHLDRAWGDPPRSTIQADDSQALAPDLRNLILHRADADLGPLRYALSDPPEWARFSLRTPLPPTALTGFLRRPVPLGTGPTVTVRSLSADEEELGRWSWTMHPVVSLFERYVQILGIHSAAVSEPETLYLAPPPRTATLSLSSDGPVDVGLRVRRVEPVPRQGFRDYALPEESRLTDRYEPWARDRWHARVPEDPDALLRARRELRVDAQVRFELPRVREEDLAEGHGSWLPSELARTAAGAHAPQTALTLSPPFELIAEPDFDQTPGLGARVRLSASASRLVVPDDGRLRIDYRGGRGLAGREATLQVGDETRVLLLPASTGTLRVDGLSPGARSVTLSGVTGLFLARAAGTPLWQSRRVIRLAPGQRQRIPLPGGEGGITIYAYAEPTALAGVFAWAILPESGAKPGLYTGMTEREGAEALSPRLERASAWPMSWSGSELTPLAPISLSLGDDLAADAELVFWLEDRSAPVWIRATASFATRAGTADAHGRLGRAP